MDDVTHKQHMDNRQQKMTGTGHLPNFWKEVIIAACVACSGHLVPAWVAKDIIPLLAVGAAAALP